MQFEQYLIQFQIKLMLLHLVVLSSTSKLRSNTREYFLLIGLFIILVKYIKYKLSVLLLKPHASKLV